MELLLLVGKKLQTSFPLPHKNTKNIHPFSNFPKIGKWSQGKNRRWQGVLWTKVLPLLLNPCKLRLSPLHLTSLTVYQKLSLSCLFYMGICSQGTNSSGSTLRCSSLPIFSLTIFQSLVFRRWFFCQAILVVVSRIIDPTCQDWYDWML